MKIFFSIFILSFLSFHLGCGEKKEEFIRYLRSQLDEFDLKIEDLKKELIELRGLTHEQEELIIELHNNMEN